MKIEYFKEYSHCLNRDMEFKVYGHGGKPILVFPAQNGRFYDFENFKMVDTVSDLIEDGVIPDNVRRLLERERKSLGISEERAKELEEIKCKA